MSLKQMLYRRLPRYIHERSWLGRVVRRLFLIAKPGVGPFLEFAEPGHFYSPIPRMENVDRISYADPPAADQVLGINLRLDAQLETLDGLTKEAARRRGQSAPGRPPRFGPNGFFSSGDAEVYAGFLNTARPARVIEVGSGFSSALLLDVLDDLELDSSVTLIEPYSERLNSVLRPGDTDRKNVRLIEQPVQDVGLDEFSQLGFNDILFIDSSHVVKAGSDVQYLFGSVIPVLRPGVLVHVHDIFWPFEYPVEWLRAGRAWNELYMMQTLLQGSSSLQIEFFGDYMLKYHSTHLDPFGGLAQGCGSLWLRKVD